LSADSTATLAQGKWRRRLVKQLCDAAREAMPAGDRYAVWPMYTSALTNGRAAAPPNNSLKTQAGLVLVYANEPAPAAHAFATAHAWIGRERGHAEVSFGFGFMLGLVHHDFPGGMEELEGIMTSALESVASAGAGPGALDARHLPAEVRDRMVSLYGKSSREG
jgi:hypothetical protein